MSYPDDEKSATRVRVTFDALPSDLETVRKVLERATHSCCETQVERQAVTKISDALRNALGQSK